MMWVLNAALALDGTVTLPLSAFENIEAAAPRIAPHHQLGRAEWKGEVDAKTGAMRLETELVVDLRGDGWKSVPILGQQAVVQSLTLNGQPVPHRAHAGFHTWTTDRTGPVVLQVAAWIPAKGGSSEYDVAIPKTPATRLVLTLPQEGLRPEVRDAVRTSIASSGGKTVLTADLSPTDKLYVLGLRDLQSEDARAAELYTETSHLVSVEDHRVEVFSVVRYSILYAGSRTFDVFLPEGLTLLDADGEGAFQYDLEPVDGGTLLKGRTRHSIRNRYEISLRLQRERASDGQESLKLPRPHRVKRDHGWAGLEVPGRVRVTEPTGEGWQRLPLQQLPEEVREASVSPILDAWRIEGDGELTWNATALPEVEVSAERIDHVTAKTLLSAQGKEVTELSFSLQNRSRHGLGLTLPTGAKVISASRDGASVVPAAREKGIMLPLRRTSNGMPQTLQLVYSVERSQPGWLGTSDFTLPVLDLPVAALSWDVHLPETHRWSELYADVRSQTRNGDGSWLADKARVAAPQQASTVPTPEGTVRSYHRYWIENDVGVAVRARHTTPWLSLSMRVGVLLALLQIAVLAFLGWMRRRRPEPPVQEDAPQESSQATT